MFAGNCSYLSVGQLDRSHNGLYFIGIVNLSSINFVLAVVAIIVILFYFFAFYCVPIAYRDGVSEGQFYQVLLYELDAIRKVSLHYM